MVRWTEPKELEMKMELINLAWHAGALIFGVWGLWIGLGAAREKALLHDAVLPLLLDANDGTKGTDSLSKSRFVRAVRYLVLRQVPTSFKGRVDVDLAGVGGVKGMTPGWEVRQLRVLFKVFKAAGRLEAAASGPSDVLENRSGTASREGILVGGAIVDVQAGAHEIVERLRRQGSVCLRLQCRSVLHEAASASTSAVSDVYWELADPSQ
jgi:hypothetical protein